MSNFDISVQFFLQIAVVLLACRCVGALAAWIGQPQVVGEMIAGVLLGPSLLGGLYPELFTAMFPKPTLPVIYTFAQIGVAFYMFVVGLEFRMDLLRARAASAAAVSIAGIAAPFALGALLGVLYHQTDAALFSPGASSVETALFLGAALSITAFPMLARIIYERGLTGSKVGALALASGAIDDVSAWCVLAIVLASFQGEPAIAVWAIGGGVAYFIFTMVVARPLLFKLPSLFDHFDAGPITRLSWVLMLAALASWFTDWIGIYAVFGGFFLGVAFPRGKFSDSIRRQSEPIVAGLLLPFFFIWSGLNTQISLVVTPTAWLPALLILAAAIAGKGIACAAAARLCGEGPRDAVAIGALMNARGLMELIIANIGLERGIITPTLYTILVVMAIVTTLLATPVFERAIGPPASAARRALVIQAD